MTWHVKVILLEFVGDMFKVTWLDHPPLEVTWDLVRLHMIILPNTSMYGDLRTWAHGTFPRWYLMISFAKNVSFAPIRIFCNFHKMYVVRGVFYVTPPHKPMPPSPSITITHTIFPVMSTAYVVLIIYDGMTSLWVFAQTAPSTWNTFLPLFTLSWDAPEISSPLWKLF